MVRDFQRVIGDEARAQMLEKIGQLPDLLVACVGGGSNAMGLFYPFLDDPCEMIGAEAAGHGLDTPRHAASLVGGSPGELHGALTYLLQSDEGQIHEAWSISAGLDYPGVGPEHSYWKDSGRVQYTHCEDDDALKTFHLVAKLEGILPALESSHAIAHALKAASRRQPDEIVVVCLSGRGDKDVSEVARLMGRDL